MTDALVGCGWCPMLLPDDYEAWYLHFFTEHGINGYSIRPNVKVTDWDIAELDHGILHGGKNRE